MPDSPREQRLAMLRGSIKLLLGIGLIFLLLPFVKSLPWPKAEQPEDVVVLTAADITGGKTLALKLRDGQPVLVTRTNARQRAEFAAMPSDQLWYAPAPDVGFAQGDQDWWVVSARSANDEAVSFQPASAQMPAHLRSASGAAWDLAGRALKPSALPGVQPPVSAVKNQNLLPMPFTPQEQAVWLHSLPAPETATSP